MVRVVSLSVLMLGIRYYMFIWVIVHNAKPSDLAFYLDHLDD